MTAILRLLLLVAMTAMVSALRGQPSAVVEVTTGTVTLFPATSQYQESQSVLPGFPTPVFFQDLLVAQPGAVFSLIAEGEVLERRIPATGKAVRWKAPPPPAETSVWGGFFAIFRQPGGDAARASAVIRNPSAECRFVAGPGGRARALPQTKAVRLMKSGPAPVTLSVYASRDDKSWEPVHEQRIEALPGIVRVPFDFGRWPGRTLTLCLLDGETPLDELVVTAATDQEAQALQAQLAALPPQEPAARELIERSMAIGAGFLPPEP